MGQVDSPGSPDVATPLKYPPLPLISHMFTVNIGHVFLFCEASMLNPFYVRGVGWVGRQEAEDTASLLSFPFSDSVVG